MRKANKEIQDRTEVEGLLQSCHVGRLGTIGPDGYPMVKPLNFVFHRGSIYFHSARKGEKMEHIVREPRVCFEADQPIALVRARKNPCDCMYLYRSVIIRGRAAIVEDETERREALDALMYKYQPEGNWGEYTQKRLGLTAVVRIDIDEMTGKEDLGEEEVNTSALRAIQNGQPLPVIIERQPD